MSTKLKSQILPLDLSNISKLLEMGGGTFQPFNYRLNYKNDNEIQLSLNSHFFDPDSVKFKISNESIHILAEMNLNLFLDNAQSPINLKQNFENIIPLPKGIDISSIYSDITTESITFFFTTE